MKKVIAFDLDDTLAISKSMISDEMAALLARLLETNLQVCIISGGRYEQFVKQVLDRIEVTGQHLGNLHLMPTCGTRYYRYDELESKWKLQYAEDLTHEQKKQIVRTLEDEAKAMGLWRDTTWGEIIEDRGSQVTYSALGQQAPAEEKYAFAEKYADEKKAFRDSVAAKLPDLEVRLGGTTSVDITRPGIDKAYGMRKLMEALEVGVSDILFVGDKLQEGGNDYPVKALGVDSIEVDGWEETAKVVQAVLYMK
jgi:HAD superfamily hydrolase (TIGR01484 family)